MLAGLVQPQIMNRMQAVVVVAQEHQEVLG
jgi:hypothetical protein